MFTDTPIGTAVSATSSMLLAAFVLSVFFWGIGKIFWSDFVFDRIYPNKDKEGVGPANLAFFEVYTPCFLGLLVGWFSGSSDGIVGAFAPAAFLGYMAINAVLAWKLSEKSSDKTVFPAFRFRVTYLVMFTFLTAFLFGSVIGAGVKRDNASRNLKRENLSEICVAFYIESGLWQIKESPNNSADTWERICDNVTGIHKEKSYIYEQGSDAIP